MFWQHNSYQEFVKVVNTWTSMHKVFLILGKLNIKEALKIHHQNLKYPETKKKLDFLFVVFMVKLEYGEDLMNYCFSKNYYEIPIPVVCDMNIMHAIKIGRWKWKEVIDFCIEHQEIGHYSLIQLREYHNLMFEDAVKEFWKNVPQIIWFDE
jgi:hypothetical protein